jgi:hypothetical protein
MLKSERPYWKRQASIHGNYSFSCYPSPSSRLSLLPFQFKEYLQRAEYLKGAVAGQDSDAHGPEGGAAAQKVKKPGAAGKEDVSHTSALMAS